MNGLFAQITKVDEEKRLVYGRAVQETPDRSDEIFDYESSKPYFKTWSDEVKADTNGKSLGNVRSMHSNVAAGKVIDMQFNDDEKAIDIAAKIVDDNEWQKVLEGVHTGFSIGGVYVGEKKTEKIDNGKEVKRYTAKPNEISLVDRPCIPTAKFFDIQKADGSVTQVEFKHQPESSNPSASESSSESEKAVEKAEEASSTDSSNQSSEASSESSSESKEYQVAGSDEDVAKLAELMDTAKLSVGDVIGMVNKCCEQAKAETEPSTLVVLGKGMYQVREMATLIDSMSFLARVCAAEEAAEKDRASVMPARMRELLKNMTDVLVELVREETMELNNEQLAMADKPGELMKLYLEKVGRRNKAEDLARIRRVRDLAKQLLDTAEELGASEGDEESKKEAEKLAKAVDSGELAKVTQSLDGALKKIDEVLSENKTLKARVEKLEAQPAYPKATLKAVPVSKSDDTNSLNPGARIDPVVKNGEVQDAATEIKKLHQQGGAALNLSPLR